MCCGEMTYKNNKNLLLIMKQNGFDLALDWHIHAQQDHKKNILTEYQANTYTYIY